MIEVGHVVWFAKHFKYCGVDKEKADAILGPSDADLPMKAEEPREEEKVRLCSLIRIGHRGKLRKWRVKHLKGHFRYIKCNFHVIMCSEF